MMLGLDLDSQNAGALWRRQEAHCWVQQVLAAKLIWMHKESLQVQEKLEWLSI